MIFIPVLLLQLLRLYDETVRLSKDSTLFEGSLSCSDFTIYYTEEYVKIKLNGDELATVVYPTGVDTPQSTDNNAKVPIKYTLVKPRDNTINPNTATVQTGGFWTRIAAADLITNVTTALRFLGHIPHHAKTRRSMVGVFPIMLTGAAAYLQHDHENRYKEAMKHWNGPSVTANDLAPPPAVSKPPRDPLVTVVPAGLLDPPEQTVSDDVLQALENISALQKRPSVYTYLELFMKFFGAVDTAEPTLKYVPIYRNKILQKPAIVTQVGITIPNEGYQLVSSQELGIVAKEMLPSIEPYADHFMFIPYPPARGGYLEVLYGEGAVGILDDLLPSIIDGRPHTFILAYECPKKSACSQQLNKSLDEITLGKQSIDKAEVVNVLKQGSMSNGGLTLCCFLNVLKESTAIRNAFDNVTIKQEPQRNIFVANKDDEREFLDLISYLELHSSLVRSQLGPKVRPILDATFNKLKDYSSSLPKNSESRMILEHIHSEHEKDNKTCGDLARFLKAANYEVTEADPSRRMVHDGLQSSKAGTNTTVILGHNTPLLATLIATIKKHSV